MLAKHRAMGRRRAREAIIGRRVTVDGQPVRRHDHEVDRFSLVELDGVPVAEPERRVHVMVHKPRGVVSATVDKCLPTVIDLVVDPDRAVLHLAGRLDRWSSGLVLLTNDGNWSKALMHPERKVPKVYEVETREPIAPDAVEAFARGFHFHTEDIVTRPVEMVLLDACKARLTLHEGRYHQIKRMFHRVGNRVERLHRTSIGGLVLPPEWEPGRWQRMTPEQVRLALAGRVPASSGA